MDRERESSEWEKIKKERIRVTKVMRKEGLDTNLDRGINKIIISKFIDER